MDGAPSCLARLQASHSLAFSKTRAMMTPMLAIGVFVAVCPGLLGLALVSGVLFDRRQVLCRSLFDFLLCLRGGVVLVFLFHFETSVWGRFQR